MPARKGQACEKTKQQFLFLPVCQEESSESLQKRQSGRKRKNFPTGSQLLARLFILTLLLVGKLVYRGESECTHSTHESKIFLPTQYDDEISTAINKCIPVWNMQDRSNGATWSSRTTGIRQAMAAPPQVRASMISDIILMHKCHKLRGMINPERKLTHINFMHDSNNNFEELHFSDSTSPSNSINGDRDVNDSGPASAGQQQQQKSDFRRAEEDANGVDDFPNGDQPANVNPAATTRSSTGSGPSNDEPTIDQTDLTAKSGLDDNNNITNNNNDVTHDNNEEDRASDSQKQLETPEQPATDYFDAM